MTKRKKKSYRDLYWELEAHCDPDCPICLANKKANDIYDSGGIKISSADEK